MNKLTPGSNQLWEGSRMILPEHKQRLNDNLKSLNKRKKPELDEQEMEEFARMIGESYERKTEIRLTIFDEYTDREETGYVVRVDRQRGRILLQTDQGDEWIDFRMVMGANTNT